MKEEDIKTDIKELRKLMITHPLGEEILAKIDARIAEEIDDQPLDYQTYWELNLLEEQWYGLRW